MQLLLHLECREAYVDPVQVGDDVEHEKERHNTAGKPGDNERADVRRGGEGIRRDHNKCAETIFSARIHPAMRNLTGEAAM